MRRLQYVLKQETTKWHFERVHLAPWPREWGNDLIRAVPRKPVCHTDHEGYPCPAPAVVRNCGAPKIVGPCNAVIYQWIYVLLKERLFQVEESPTTSLTATQAHRRRGTFLKEHGAVKRLVLQHRSARLCLGLTSSLKARTLVTSVVGHSYRRHYEPESLRSDRPYIQYLNGGGSNANYLILRSRVDELFSVALNLCNFVLPASGIYKTYQFTFFLTAPFLWYVFDVKLVHLRSLVGVDGNTRLGLGRSKEVFQVHLIESVFNKNVS